ncbi:AarF/ABC1/UbiB kinase family protein [Oscillatoria sp. FACHB-1406]|uniref:ABC1 kinase family protein n=1 Tax=Oscillatoria sp. FACHB-1406 TaxID=2692846 RepID=UPI0016894863|nr:AarF/ABC1/UbiB kinase family protein [Oscillatoria sp. FACHB-1406]MBD2578222.1 AarF/ABC1/UbiB kinase family protein [Oscillatoria sp. FACHB-1406]
MLNRTPEEIRLANRELSVQTHRGAIDPNFSKTLELPPWQQAKYSPNARQFVIFRSVAQFLFYLGCDRVLGKNTPQQRTRRAQWLTARLLYLGPTFIKIGQALSTRPDLIPVEYIESLSQLQDRVPEFSPDLAMSVIETELGQPLETLFLEFDTFPLAAASLGQVHRAKLPTGEEVVVKVQRPAIEPLFNLDFEVIHRLVRLANRYLPGARKYELEAIYREFFSILYKEIDYIHEGKNADRFRENFSQQPNILIPRVFWKYTTQRVLTLEYLPGIKIDDRTTLIARGIAPDDILKLGICSYLKQLLQDGFFQSDPHPGNMAVSLDGRLIFYDFGTMAEVKTLAKDQMINTFFAVLKKDADELVKTLMYLGLIEPVADMTPVRRTIAFLLERFRERPVDVREFDQIRDELYIMFEQQPFRLPAQMTFIIKAITTLDGIARALDPQYNLLAASQPFIQSLTMGRKQDGKLLGTLARQARSFITYKLTQPNKVEVYIQRLEERIDRGELQIRVRSQESERLLRRINMGLKCLIYLGASGFSLMGGLMLWSIYQGGAIALLVCAGVWFPLFLRALIKLLLRERMDNLASR